ncbi:MAG: hypothetical protein Kow00109_17290 [Acidobacteriota bacterium]
MNRAGIASDHSRLGCQRLYTRDACGPPLPHTKAEGVSPCSSAAKNRFIRVCLSAASSQVHGGGTWDSEATTNGRKDAK